MVHSCSCSFVLLACQSTLRSMRCFRPSDGKNALIDCKPPTSRLEVSCVLYKVSAFLTSMRIVIYVRKKKLIRGAEIKEKDFWSKKGSPAPSAVNCSSFFNSNHSPVVSVMDLGCKNIVMLLHVAAFQLLQGHDGARADTAIQLYCVEKHKLCSLWLRKQTCSFLDCCMRGSWLHINIWRCVIHSLCHRSGVFVFCAAAVAKHN